LISMLAESTTMLCTPCVIFRRNGATLFRHIGAS
jgi:hypothetical protein